MYVAKRDSWPVVVWRPGLTRPALPGATRARDTRRHLARPEGCPWCGEDRTTDHACYGLIQAMGEAAHAPALHIGGAA